MQSTFFRRHPALKDILGVVMFIVAVVLGALLINTFVFRSFSVAGPSMEPTLYTGDRLIVNRLPLTWKQITDDDYIPDRNQVIVFKNPHYSPGGKDKYIVKRVIALPGEQVEVKDGELTVYNEANPQGFHPKLRLAIADGPTSPTFGNLSQTVPEGKLFVVGDHRQAGFSLDSRNGLGTIPLDDIVGPVAVRIYPFDRFRGF